MTLLKTQSPARWLLITLLFSASVAALAGTQTSATRARKVVPERKTATPKAKPKPITAREIKEAKERLAALGYWLKTDAESFRHALIAFQKVENLKPTGRLTFADLEVLRAANTPAPKETKTLEEGKIRVEVDLQRQVLFVIEGENKVTKILPVSSGNGKEFKSEGFLRDAVTPPGRFNVYGKIKGWKKSPLGMLYYPNYYLSGLAIHGSKFVPAYPDSHGCIRIPMYAAEEFYQMATVGTEILIHGQPEVKE
ncbi:MAG TPA: L,D-transpeptidase family protein [Blastocatellia bacterium]|nr:L,D-transpeptidase family protein [Blastocatellia bacterium]